jgi:hypothetical protein
VDHKEDDNETHMGAAFMQEDIDNMNANEPRTTSETEQLQYQPQWEVTNKKERQRSTQQESVRMKEERKCE